MPQNPIHQPHDKLFKVTFSDPDNAAVLLRPQIRPASSQKLGWNRLRLEPGSYIDHQYLHTETDLLFSTTFSGSDCLLYLLFEHQTTQDRLLPFRLLRYMIRIWEAHLKKEPAPGKLPVILPVVLAQNAEIWDVSTQFSSLVKLPKGMEEEFGAFVPDFTFRLIQLAAIAFEDITGTPIVRATLLFMKARISGQLLDDRVWDEALMLQLPREHLELLIRYMLSADIDKAAFDRKVRQIRQSELRSTTMTLAEQIHEEGLEKGLEKGREEGRQEGRQEDILEALRLRFGTVPPELAAAIREIHDEDRLRSLFITAIQSPTVEEFTRTL